MNNKKHIGPQILAVILIYFLAFINSPALGESNKKLPIYFYSCETNINNLKFLKIKFDNYLSNFGFYEFIPFNSRKSLEQALKNQKKYLVIISGWHYLQICSKYSLDPLMVGVKNGKTHQKRILVAEKHSDIQALKTGQIASATSIQHTLNELNVMLKSKIDSSKILTVPRDIDALMSVGIGISQCALATENSFEKLNQIHPSLFQRMKTLAKGNPSLLLIVAAHDAFSKPVQKAATILENMHINQVGKDKIKMLGLDGWKKISNIDKMKIRGL